jgi:hypothetical protein
MTLYNASLSYVDVNIFWTGEFNYFFSIHCGSKRGGKYEIVFAHLSSPQIGLKLCTLFYCYL